MDLTNDIIDLYTIQLITDVVKPEAEAGLTSAYINLTNLVGPESVSSFYDLYQNSGTILIAKKLEELEYNVDIYYNPDDNDDYNPDYLSSLYIEWSEREYSKTQSFSDKKITFNNVVANNAEWLTCGLYLTPDYFVNYKDITADFVENTVYSIVPGNLNFSDASTYTKFIPYNNNYLVPSRTYICNEFQGGGKSIYKASSGIDMRPDSITCGIEVEWLIKDNLSVLDYNTDLSNRFSETLIKLNDEYNQLNSSENKNHARLNKIFQDMYISIPTAYNQARLNSNAIDITLKNISQGELYNGGIITYSTIPVTGAIIKYSTVKNNINTTVTSSYVIPPTTLSGEIESEIVLDGLEFISTPIFPTVTPVYSQPLLIGYLHDILDDQTNLNTIIHSGVVYDTESDGISYITNTKVDRIIDILDDRYTIHEDLLYLSGIILIDESEEHVGFVSGYGPLEIHNVEFGGTRRKHHNSRISQMSSL